MKTILEFNLPEDQEEMRFAMQGAEATTALQELDNWLRSKIKYGQLEQDSEAIYQECRDKLNELLSARDVRI